MFTALKEDRLLSLSFLIIEPISTVLQGWVECSLGLKHSFTQKLFTIVTCCKHTYELQSIILHSFEQFKMLFMVLRAEQNAAL